jgi:hypothetical protein
MLQGQSHLWKGDAPGWIASSDNVVVERVCNGVVRREGYTDSKRFRFQRWTIGMFYEAARNRSSVAGISGGFWFATGHQQLTLLDARFAPVLQDRLNSVPWLQTDAGRSNIGIVRSINGES